MYLDVSKNQVEDGIISVAFNKNQHYNVIIVFGFKFLTMDGSTY